MFLPLFLFTVALTILLVMVIVFKCKSKTKESFTETDDLNAILLQIENNNDILANHDAKLRTFYNSYYDGDTIDAMMSEERASIAAVNKSMEDRYGRMQGMLGDFVTKADADAKFVTVNDMERKMSPYMTSLEANVAFEKNMNAMNDVFYKGETASSSFLTKGEYAEHQQMLASVDSKVDLVKQRTDELKSALDNLVRLEQVEGVYLPLSDFDQMRENISHLRSKIDQVDGRISESRTLYDLTQNVMDVRFKSYQDKIDLVGQQNENIRQFLMNDYSPSESSNFVFQHDMDRLTGEVRVLEEQLTQRDDRVDNMERKLLNMTHEVCVGQECMNHGDFKDLKEVTRYFKTQYKGDRDAMKVLQEEMDKDQVEIGTLRSQLLEEIQLREQLVARYNAQLDEVRARLKSDNDAIASRYQGIIKGLREERDSIKTKLNDFISSSAQASQGNNAIVGELQGKILQLEQTVAQVQYDKGELQKRLDSLVDAYEDENGGFQRRLRAKDAIIFDLNARLGSAMKLLTSNQLVMQEQTRNLTSINKELADAKGSITNLRTRNRDLEGDTSRLSQMVATIQGSVSSLNAELQNCNTEKSLRIPLDQHNLVKQDLQACNTDKQTNYVSTAALNGTFVSRDQHDSEIDACRKDKQDNYVARYLVDAQYVLRDDYDRLKRDIGDPTKYVSAENVAQNYKTKADYQNLVMEYANDYVRRSMYDEEMRKARLCETDRNKYYQHIDTINANYISNHAHQIAINNEKDICTVEKNRDYVTMDRWTQSRHDLNSCENEKTRDYVTKVEYNAMEQKLNTCESSKYSGYMSKEYVDQEYFTKAKCNKDLLLCHAEHKQDKDTNYYTHKYVDVNFVDKQTYNADIDKQNKNCASEKNALIQSHNTTIATDYLKKKDIDKTYVLRTEYSKLEKSENKTKSDLTNCKNDKAESDSKAQKIANATRNGIHMQNVPISRLLDYASDNFCGADFGNLECPTGKQCVDNKCR